MPIASVKHKAAKPASIFSHTTRAFKHRNYRLFFGGQFVSLIGTWITSVATSWLAFRLTNSEWMLGLVGFCGQFPSFLLAPIAGVLVDRWNRRYVLIATQAASMLQSSALAYLTLSGSITVNSLCALCVVQALINAFDMPARQSFLTELIENKADLPNAIALNSAMFNGARLIGPAVGGLIIAFSNEGICFAIDALSFLAVLVSLFCIRIAAESSVYSKQQIIKGLVEGAGYALRSIPIREILTLVALTSLFGTWHLVLMPVFVHEVLHGGPGLLGSLMGASGLGAVCGALYLASRRNVLGLGNFIVGAGFLLSFSIIGFSCSQIIWLSITLSFLSGAAMITQFAASNTILQTLVEPEKRGRVMSFYVMSFLGMMPIGSLISGALASHIGAPRTVFFAGLACFCAAVYFFRKLPDIREAARPIYRKLGIITGAENVQ